VALMALLASSAPPPTPSLERSYAEAKAAFDCGQDVLPMVEAALALAGARNDETVWRLRVLHAKAIWRRGNPSKALEEVSAPLPSALRDSDVAIDRLLILGYLSKDPRNFEQARQIAAAKHPKRLGEVLYVQARHAEPELRAALRVAKRSGDVATEAKILGTLGLVVAGNERFDEAIDFAQRARRLAPDCDVTFLHRTEGNLGWYYNELGDRDSAEEHLRNAVSIAARVHADENRVVYLLQLGQSEMSRGDRIAARRDFVTARDVAVALGSQHTASALVDIATLELLDGHIALARQINESARPSTPDVTLQSRILAGRIDFVQQSLDEARDVLLGVIHEANTKSMRWEAESWLAQVYAARHEERQADQHFRTAIATVDEARSDIGSDELRFSFPDVAAQLYDAYIEFLVGQHRDVDALRVAELNRARTLSEGLKPESDERFEPAETVRAARTVAFSYRLGRARSFVWMITPAGVQRFDLPPAETIQRTVNEYTKAIALHRGSAQGEALYRMLVAPAAGLLRGVSEVAIIPDGRLAGLNFETLVNPATHRYWIEEVTIESVPSLRLLSPPRKEAESGRLLLVENAQPTDRTLAPLRYAADEMQRVRSHFATVTALVGAAATPRAYVAAEPERYAFIHFVAHGVATQQRPLDSAIVLAADPSGYKLYARQILEQHRLHARLVTISSCFGAGRRAYQGEGLVGLAWAFLGAGAHEVIAALWEVNDRATPDLMDAMYTAIRAGHDPVDALRIAKLKLLHSHTVYAKPFYWATFVVYTGA
jgi:CHAT domain-containing protein